ncbi:hypothetical protein Sj15T_25900 [Sphingobium sp. TA15]|nr:hypothetical protein Sj15T_25900 [Sphingobium sp. TA15]
MDKFKTRQTERFEWGSDLPPIRHPSPLFVTPDLIRGPAALGWARTQKESGTPDQVRGDGRNVSYWPFPDIPNLSTRPKSPQALGRDRPNHIPAATGMEIATPAPAAAPQSPAPPA